MGIEGKKEGSNDDPLRPALTMEDLEKEKDSPIMEWVKKLGEIHKKFSQCLAYGRYRNCCLPTGSMPLQDLQRSRGF